MFKGITSRDAGSMTTSREGDRMPRSWNVNLRRMNLIVLVVMLSGATMGQAQESLEDLQKRKTIAEAEREAIQAEIARDEARKKQSELGAPLDPLKKAKDDAVEAANSAKTQTEARKAQSDAQNLCVHCLQAAQEELKKCLEGAISQEDKKSCAEKRDARAKACENGECTIARGQSGHKNEGLPGRR